ncbi:MAG TPA: hypothetical protein VF618_03070 [Thermoanaerobaculia bacterium]
MLGLTLLSSSVAAGVNQWTVVGPPANVRTMAVDPHDPNLLYAAGHETVARSADRGATWTVTELPGLTLPSRIRVAVSVPSTLYALGSGELFQSTNGGVSWTRRTVPATFPRDLQVDATNANILVVAAVNFCFLSCRGGGVYRSENGGGSWREIGFEHQDVDDVALDPTSSQVVYATRESKLLRTTNGGRLWRELPLSATGLEAVAVDAVDPATIYAAAGEGLFRSEDSGQSWALIRPSEFGANIADPLYRSPQLFVTGGGAALSVDQGHTFRNISTTDSGLDIRSSHQLVVSRDTCYMVVDLGNAQGQIIAYEVRLPRRRAAH